MAVPKTVIFVIILELLQYEFLLCIKESYGIFLES